MGVATDMFGSLTVRESTFAAVWLMAVSVTRLEGCAVTEESGIGIGPPVHVLFAETASGESRSSRVSDARSVSGPPSARVAFDHASFRTTLLAIAGGVAVVTSAL